MALAETEGFTLGVSYSWPGTGEKLWKTYRNRNLRNSPQHTLITLEKQMITTVSCWQSDYKMLNYTFVWQILLTPYQNVILQQLGQTPCWERLTDWAINHNNGLGNCICSWRIRVKPSCSLVCLWVSCFLWPAGGPDWGSCCSSASLSGCPGQRAVPRGGSVCSRVPWCLLECPLPGWTLEWMRKMMTMTKRTSLGPWEQAWRSIQPWFDLEV